MTAALRVALGAYGKDPALRARLGAIAPMEFAEVTPISRAFAPMVRELAYDISEMALFTFLQARAYGKPLALLPVVIAARHQEAALLCRTDDISIAGPTDLKGKRIGVRAYSQTTGAWLRGVLADDFRLPADRMEWVTFEDAHVPEYRDPPWAERAAAGSDIVAMLKQGALDAIVVGNDVPNDPALRTVFADPAAAGRRFIDRHGFVPVNHMIAVRQGLADQTLVAVADALGKRSSIAALEPVIALATRYAAEQGLTLRQLSGDEVWVGTPEAFH